MQKRSTRLAVNLAKYIEFYFQLHYLVVIIKVTYIYSLNILKKLENIDYGSFQEKNIVSYSG